MGLSQLGRSGGGGGSMQTHSLPENEEQTQTRIQTLRIKKKAPAQPPLARLCTTLQLKHLAVQLDRQRARSPTLSKGGCCPSAQRTTSRQPGRRPTWTTMSHGLPAGHQAQTTDFCGRPTQLAGLDLLSIAPNPMRNLLPKTMNARPNLRSPTLNSIQDQRTV